MNVQHAAISGQNKYLEILEDAWGKHLATKSHNAPKVISTFAGCGGSSLGYSMAGFKELLAVEWDKNAVTNFKLNFPEVPVYQGDIAKLSITELFDITGLRSGDLDVFDGSPPCQGFSSSGKRELTDSRNWLFKEYLRLLKALMPKVFIMENVSGMIKGKMKIIFTEILKDLKACGYNVIVQLLNASYFYVPQVRERLIFIGIRKDLKLSPSLPKAISNQITPKIAFENVAPDEIKDLPDWLRKAAKYIHSGNYNHKSVERSFLYAKGSKGGSMNTKLLDWNRTACTLIKSEISATGIIHPDRERYLTINEMKRIGSFPDAFQLIGTRKDKVARIGNSVPPLMMKAIADHIRSNFLSKLSNLDDIER